MFHTYNIQAGFFVGGCPSIALEFDFAKDSIVVVVSKSRKNMLPKEIQHLRQQAEEAKLDDHHIEQGAERPSMRVPRGHHQSTSSWPDVTLLFFRFHIFRICSHMLSSVNNESSNLIPIPL
eukprot:GEMP01106812.1.p2 GENE.GEMP01106812.1~~GEMP01106812.1.p2  ORF type:complete len:121 (-),score=14.48 GEMP01106812.1:86-448(-)